MIARKDFSLARIIALGLTRPFATPLEATQHLGALQAQDLPGTLRSLTLRSEGSAVDAFNSGQLVRNWPMRETLHAVASEDIGWMLALTAPRMESSAASRHRALGVDEGLLKRARASTERLFSEVDRVTRAELFARWDADGLIEGVRQRGIHMLSMLCRRNLLTQGPLEQQGRRWEQLIVPAETWITRPLDLAEDDALALWARRFFISHGPATEADFARWTGLTLARVRRGIAANTDLAHFELDGVRYYMDADLPDRLASERRRAARMMLLPGFDELILGYKDRSATVPPAFAEAIVPGNNGMFKATVVDRGQVVGTWKQGTATKSQPNPAPVVSWLVEPSKRQLADLARGFTEHPSGTGAVDR